MYECIYIYIYINKMRERERERAREREIERERRKSDVPNAPAPTAARSSRLHVVLIYPFLAFLVPSEHCGIEKTTPS